MHESLACSHDFFEDHHYPCNHTVLGNTETQRSWEVWEGEAWHAFQRMQLAYRRYENPSCANCASFHEKPDNIDKIPMKYLNEKRWVCQTICDDMGRSCSSTVHTISLFLM
jgi:hypothetical protein